MPTANTPTTIKVISFDLDDTLWPLADTLAKAEEAYYQWLCERCPEVAEHTIESLRQQRREYLLDHPQHQHQISQLRVEATQQLLHGYGYDDAKAISEEGFKHFIQWRNAVTPYPDTKTVLAQLSETYRLIAITNGNVDLQQTELAGYFDFCLSAEQLNASKPMPEPFQIARHRCAVNDNEIAHVGDHIEHDIKGASNQGWRTIWLDHGHCEQGDIQPDAIINDIAQLPAAISALNNTAI
ncbi:putative hydrolase of the HAD superfamily [Sinobacterium caligoides]|uniref:Putative hydrolase of the HAD superfamily n=1 Tax=Sinobacterium caligoides TaxID=933926 RepID=A0A3N2DQ90_9GAMM|nr:HAD family hydrolase [Sinobacterium caligoides]ROS02004.1 putative hydrolase of the HAD superfamily [Sinobacterium caligoides]